MKIDVMEGQGKIKAPSTTVHVVKKLQFMHKPSLLIK